MTAAGHTQSPCGDPDLLADQRRVRRGRVGRLIGLPSQPAIDVGCYSDARILFMVSISCRWLVSIECANAIAAGYCPELISVCAMLIAPW
jgi:hypothetical protein